MRLTFLLISVIIQVQLFGQPIKIIQPVRFLALGDSYTIGQSVEEQERWPEQLKDALQNNGIAVSELTIIAQTGWRTDDLINAIESRNPASNYNLVSLLIGVNNQFQGADFDVYVAEFEQLLKTAIALAGNVRESVFVVSIPDYGYTPFGRDYREIISPEIDKYNLANRQLAGKYGVAYIDITPVSREGLEKPEYVAGEGLHPSGEMYAEWVKQIMESMDLFYTANRKIGNSAVPAKILIHSDEKKIVFTSFELTGKKPVYQVIDSSGRLTLSGRITENEIDISGLGRGVYLFRLVGDVVFSKKFVISE